MTKGNSHDVGDALTDQVLPRYNFLRCGSSLRVNIRFFLLDDPPSCLEDVSINFRIWLFFFFFFFFLFILRYPTYLIHLTHIQDCNTCMPCLFFFITVVVLICYDNILLLIRDTLIFMFYRCASPLSASSRPTWPWLSPAPSAKYSFTGNLRLRVSIMILQPMYVCSILLPAQTRC